MSGNGDDPADGDTRFAEDGTLEVYDSAQRKWAPYEPEYDDTLGIMFKGEL